MTIRVSGRKNNALAETFSGVNFGPNREPKFLPRAKNFGNILTADRYIYIYISNHNKMASGIDKDCSQIDAEMACLFCREAKKTSRASRLKLRLSKKEKDNER